MGEELTEEIIADISATHNVDVDTAKSFAQEAISQSQENHPGKVVQKSSKVSDQGDFMARAIDAVIRNPCSFLNANRRDFILGFTILAADKIIEHGLPGIPINEENNAWSSDDKLVGDDFIDLINANRSNPSVREVAIDRFGVLSRGENLIVRALQAMVSVGPGNYLPGIENFLSNTDNHRVRLIVGDIVSTEYIRHGIGAKARSVFPGELKFGSNFDMLLHAEKKFSLGYTEAPREDALNTRAWDFSPAFKSLERSQYFDNIVRFSRGEGHFNIDFKGMVNVNDDLISLDVKGFYCLCWTIIYWMANGDDNELRERSKLLESVLIEYGRFKIHSIDTTGLYSYRWPFARQVWNMAYIVALYLHRRAKGSMQYDKISDIRDIFISLQLNSSEGFAPDYAMRFSNVTPSDVMAVSASLFYYSEPFISRQFNVRNVDPDKLVDMSDLILPPGLRRAVDMLRKRKVRDIPPRKRLRDNWSSWGTLEIHAPTDEEIFNAISDL